MKKKNKEISQTELKKIDWRKEHTLAISIRINRDKQPDIIKKLESVENVREYIEKLILKDIKGE